MCMCIAKTKILKTRISLLTYLSQALLKACNSNPIHVFTSATSIMNIFIYFYCQSLDILRCTENEASLSRSSCNVDL